MVLDIDLFRSEKGHDPQLIRDSQKKRYKRIELVDEVIEYDSQWRIIRFQADQWNKMKCICGRTIGIKIKAKENEGDFEELPENFKINLQILNADLLSTLTIKQLKRVSLLIDLEIYVTNETLIKIENDRNSALHEIGNIVHQSVPISDNEVNLELDLKKNTAHFRIIILPNELSEMLKHEKNIHILI
jgi:seryl-tRNA synthetase